MDSYMAEAMGIMGSFVLAFSQISVIPEDFLLLASWLTLTYPLEAQQIQKANHLTARNRQSFQCCSGRGAVSQQKCVVSFESLLAPRSPQ